MASDLQIQGEVVVNSEQAESAFNRVGDKAQQMANEVATSAGKAGQAVDKIGDGAGASAEKFTRAESRISASIKRATNELELLGKTASQRLEFNIADKGLDPKKFEPMLQRLREVEQRAREAERAATGSLDNMGMSAKATAAAMRGVPAQFQDIIVSLQGGQAPMTVLLQQGSQLSGMFGGVGNAAKALGTYIVGLVNPLTIAAAAVAGLGFAMYSLNGKDAALRDLSVQLIGTGRASVAAAGDIKILVNELNTVPGVSKAAATAIIGEFAKVSGLGANLFKDLGASVADFAAATGTDLPTAAKKLAEAFADPEKGAKALEDSLGTLTAAQILNITKMAEMGDKSGAQAALLDALKQATEGLAKQGMTPLGEATDKMSNAWDKLTTSVGNSSAFRTANDWLAKLIEKTADLTVRLSQMQPPTWLKFLPVIGPAIGAASLFAGPENSGGSRYVSGKVGNSEGGATGWGPTADDIEKQVKAALDLTRSYESQSAAMEKLRGISSVAKDALQALEKQQKGNSVEANELRERIAGVNEKLAEMAKKGGAAPKGGDQFAADREAAKQWASYVEKFTKGAAEAKAKTEGLTKSQAELVEYLQSPAYINASEPMREMALQAAYVYIAQEQLNDATKQAAKVAADAAKSHAQFVMELSKGATAAEQQAEQLRLEEEAAAIAETGYYSLAQAIELVTIKRLEEQQKGMIGNEDAYLAVQKEIDARKKLVALIGSKEARKASEDAAKSAASEWQRAADDINRSLTDALLRGFESGKDFAKNLRDTIANMFKTLVLRPIISAVINPISGAIAGLFGSGAATAATGAASAGSAIGGIGSVISAGTSAFGIGASYGFQSLFANGMGATLSAGGQMIGAGSYMAGAGTIVGALAPIALGIGALVAISKATKGETRTGGQFGVAFDGSVTNQRRGQTYVIEGQQFDRDFTNGMRTALKDGIAYRLEGDPVAQEQAIRNAVSGTAASINSILKSLGSAAVLTGFSAGLETSSKGRGGVFAGGTLSGGLQFGESGKGDNYDGTLYEKFSTNSPDFKTALENFTLDLKQSTVQALQTVSDIPKTVQMMLAGVNAESLTEEAANQLLEAVNSQVVGVNTLRAAISPMGGIFSSIAAASFDAQSRLISLSGGVDQFLQNAGQFVAQYYNETEQAGVAAVQLATVLEGVGIDLTALGVDTKGEFRALVESMDVNTDAGQEQVAALLQVAPQFAELADFLQKNNMTLEQLADSAPQVSALEKLLSPQEQTAASTAESAELLGNLVGETSRVSSAISGLAASIESSTVNIVVQNQASSNVTVPRFAAGGAHQGGMRLVGENGPEFEFTGPSAIYSTSNSTDMLAAAVERGFIAGAAKSTLSVKSMAPMAAGSKTAEDIFLTNFKDWYPEFADRLNKDTIKQLMNFDLLKFSASGSSVTPELLDTVLKLFEEGFSSDKVNQYVELIRGSNPEGQVTNPNLYLEQFKLRTQWGWTPEQIKAEVQGLATTALDSTLKSLYAGVVSKKDLDQVRQVVGESSNAAGITQENLAKLFDAGLLRDYLSKDAAGQYSLRASEMFSQGGGADGAANAEQQRMNDLLAERRQLEIQLLQAQGQEQEALNRIRANAIEGMSAEAVAAWDFNRALEKQIEQAQQVADLKQEHSNLQLELLKAQGRDEEALALIREEAIKGMTAEAVALHDVNRAVQEQIDILNERKGLERRLLEAQGDTAAIRQLELAATHEANRAILLRIWALEDEKKAAEAAQTAVDAAFDALKRAVQSAQEAAEKALKDTYEATEKTLKEQISAAEKIRSAASESLSSLEGIFDLLKDQIKDLRNEAGAAAPVSEGNAYLDRLIASGAKPKQDELADAIDSVRAGQKAERYGSAFEYNRDNLALAGRLDTLKDKIGLQKTIAEQQLKAAEDSLVTLNEQLETAKTQYEEQLAKTKEYYEKVLENAQTQIDVLRGVDTSVLGVTAAVTALNAAVAAAAAQVTAAVYSISVDSDSTTTTTATANDTTVNSRARGGYTPAGLTVVGEEGPELVNFAQPSMVYTSAQTRNLLGWGDSEGVIAELRSLREDNRAQAQALVRMQARLVALMERWDGDGMPEERATA